MAERDTLYRMLNDHDRDGMTPLHDAVLVSPLLFSFGGKKKGAQKSGQSCSPFKECGFLLVSLIVSSCSFPCLLLACFLARLFLACSFLLFCFFFLRASLDMSFFLVVSCLCLSLLIATII